MPSIFTWSFSKINAFEICPYKHNQISILKKISDEWNIEAKKGIEDHESLEYRLQKNTPLPPHLQKMENTCRIICKSVGELHAETKFCLNRNLEPTGYKDWNNGWFRSVIDILKVHKTKAWIGDWKTGKIKNDPAQLDLFAATVFKYYPKVENITANYIWIKEGKLSPTLEYTRKDTAAIWDKQLMRVFHREYAFKENQWPTKVSGLCKSYCIINKLGRCPDKDVPQHVPPS